MKNSTNTKAGQGGLTRRKFMIASGTAAAAVTIVPRHVLGGAGFVAPSEKIVLAQVGCGTEGLRELTDLLKMPEVQVVAVCDPVMDSQEYVDWSKDSLRWELAQAMGRPDWRKDVPGIPGGRNVAKELIETVYANQKSAEKYKGCATYVDFRELLDKEKDVNAIKIMTPDHLHATVAIAAMKQGKHVVLHKPLANRVQEGRWVIETARKTKVATHFMPASEGGYIRPIKAWVDNGAIGTLREIHNWSNRPVWPQYPVIPVEKPPVPPNFDWQLWLGPSQDRPYSPQYTHAVFRGWYEFGGGAIADMGHYSLWPVFQLLELDSPTLVESHPSHVCTLNGQVATRIQNDYSFPAACTIRFKFPAKGNRPAIDLFWYDGSMKPQTPDELEAQNEELPAEGMMWVGDKGKILAGFRGEGPELIGGDKSKTQIPPPGGNSNRAAALSLWAAACKGGPATYGDFLLAGPITDAFNLGAVSLRMGGKRLQFHADNMKITNLPDADQYLGRSYRKGWELTGPGA